MYRVLSRHFLLGKPQKQYEHTNYKGLLKRLVQYEEQLLMDVPIMQAVSDRQYEEGSCNLAKFTMHKWNRFQTTAR